MDINKLKDILSNKKFKSEKELKEFMDNIIGKTLNDLPSEDSNEEQAASLVYEAYEQPVAKAKKTIKKALALDPKNIRACNYLASVERNVDSAIKKYKKSIKLAKEKLGEEFFEEETGYFWGMTETRPFMNAMHGLGGCYSAKHKFNEAIDIYEEMLVLNPSDNQGVRYLLSTLYLRTNQFKKFKELTDKYEEFYDAVSGFNSALAQFKQEKQSELANKLLLTAHTNNPFVIDLLLGNKKMPKQHPDYIGVGDENEAVAYVFGNFSVWEETSGAFEWLYQFLKNRQEIN